MEFELSRLASYDDESMLAELRRVAAILDESAPLTAREFNLHSKVDPTTVRRRFGTWEAALSQAGLSHRYSGRRVTSKSLNQVGRNTQEAELIHEMRRVAGLLESDTLTREQFDAHSAMSAATPSRRFGSWPKALQAAGLSSAVRGRRYTERDYFENILEVWTHYGRQPKYGEMNRAPSRISAGGYEKRFGGWTRALVAFVDFANSDQSSSEHEAPAPDSSTICARSVTPADPASPANRRSISLGLRYDVLRRDHFKCVLCGASPATDQTCKLHVDHILAFSKGGTTTPDNLRTTCEQCNLGKSDKLESSVQQWLQPDGQEVD